QRSPRLRLRLARRRGWAGLLRWAGGDVAHVALHDFLPPSGNPRLKELAADEAEGIESLTNQFRDRRLVFCIAIRKNIRLPGVVSRRVIVRGKYFKRFGQVVLLVEHDANLLEVLGILP